MTIEQYQTDEVFDIATLRMVAEHISDPESVIESLNRLMRPGGCVVIYTPNKWSLMSMVASIIPDNLHASVVRIFSPRRQDEDVFPTCYKMNTKRTLRYCLKTEALTRLDLPTSTIALQPNGFESPTSWSFACGGCFNWLESGTRKTTFLGFIRNAISRLQFEPSTSARCLLLEEIKIIAGHKFVNKPCILWSQGIVKWARFLKQENHFGV